MKTESVFSTNKDDLRWQAVLARRVIPGDIFFYGVVSTHIYCRPGCASRLPRREQIRFFESAFAAETAGFRACKRCCPNLKDPSAPQRELIQHACTLLAETAPALTLAEVAGQVGLSPFHFQRIFKKIVGVSPKQYQIQRRSNLVKQAMQEEEHITDAIYRAGYGSSSRFYAQTEEMLGMKPGQYKKGAQGMSISYAIQSSSLGWVLVAATPTGICAIEFGDSAPSLEKRLQERFAQATFNSGDAIFTERVRQVLAFVESPRQEMDLPLDVQGTAFQRRVWMALRRIPAGETASYIEIARQIGQPTAMRAVAQACASNHIALVIPCHRVVRANGEPGGYRWGVERKLRLLEREKAGNE